MISVAPSGNCNFSYLSGLRQHSCDNMAAAMRDALTATGTGIHDTWNNKYIPPRYRENYAGMWLFAQGSEDPIEQKPYANAFADFIEKHDLGQVIRLPGVPNIQHANKKGYLFVWILNRSKMLAWWQQNVEVPDKLEQENKKAAVAAAQAVKPQVI